MFKLTAKNVRGLRALDIYGDERKVTIFAGLNFQGKTSTYLSAVSVFGNVKEFRDEHGKELKIIRDGETEGHARLDINNEYRVHIWTEKGHKGDTSKSPPAVLSDYALGVKKFARRSLKERSDDMGKLLDARPTAKDFSDTCFAAGIWNGADTDDFKGNEDLRQVFNDADILGWDTAWTKANDNGKYLKRRLGELTNTTGPEKAALYKVPNIGLVPEGATEESLVAAHQEAIKAHDVAVKAAAIDEHRIKNLEEKAKGKPILEDEIENLKREITELDGHLATGAALLMSMALDLCPARNCPECGVDLTINKAGEIVRLEKTSKADPVEAKAKHAAQQKDVLAREKKLIDLKAQLANKKTTLEVADQANMDLLKLKTTKGTPVPSEFKPSETAALIESARKALTAFNAQAEITKTIDALNKNLDLQKILAPDGLRREILSQQLGMFIATYLDPLTELAKWKNVGIDPDLRVTYGGRNYAECSESEQFRCDVILQLALARVEGDHLILIDRNEVLDSPALSELLGLLLRNPNKIGAMLFLKSNKASDIPDLEAKKLGNSYWISNGEATPLRLLAAGVK